MVLLEVMGTPALAHGPVCPGVVNAKRFSAAVEAAPAALRRPVSRGWKNTRQGQTFESSAESKTSSETQKRRYVTFIVEPVSHSFQILKLQA